MSDKNNVPEFEKRSESRELVVILHAFTNRPAQMKSLRDIVLAEKPDADVFCPELPLKRWSFTHPLSIVNTLLKRIDEIWERHSYESIVLIGHSVGALLVRQLYICACGENENAPFGRAPEGDSYIKSSDQRPWAAAVDRIILLAAVNRGWSINHHVSKWNAFVKTVGVLLANIVMLFRKGEPLIFTIRRGSKFVTSLRVQWLLMRDELRKMEDKQQGGEQQAKQEKPIGGALTVQLLGTIDDVVSPEDNLDLISGRDFVYLEVPHSGHANVIKMNDPEFGEGRAEVFKEALLDEEQVLRENGQFPADDPQEEAPEVEKVNEVIFVIHGIRDEGFWTHKIARRIRTLGQQDNRTFATETSSYGYFPMLHFLFPWQRREKVRWFMDQYVEAVARYPEARDHFHFVGHSHGTYLLAKALEEYDCCRFEKVVFAGSVVRRKYEWGKYLGQRVKAVANYVATGDWVVAIFPKSFEQLHLQDVGSAGHDGFQSGEVKQVEYVKGDHGAAIQEQNWNWIADFIVNPVPAETDPVLFTEKRKTRTVLYGTFAWLILLGLVGLVAAGGYLIYLAHPYLGFPEWATTLALVIYLYVVYAFLTKF